MLHPAYAALTAAIRATDAPVILFAGFSGAGYEDLEAVKASMKAQILAFAAKTMPLDGARWPDATPIFVVAGATAMGVGAVYAVADELKARGLPLRTVGIVSERASRWPEDLAPGLDCHVDVADPDGTWKVLMDDGRSYMVDVLMHSSRARAVFLGGGLVTRSELEELARRLENGEATGSVEVEIRRGSRYAPSPAAVEAIIAKRRAKGQTVDPYVFDGTRDFAEGVHVGAPPRLAAAPEPSGPVPSR